jgi:hypothetical protein
MGWEWNPSDPLIHIHCKLLWGHKYIFEYQKIYKEFIIPLYEILFYKLMPFMTGKCLTIVGRVGYWYLFEYGTYIRVYGTMKATHMLRKFTPDMLVLQEITYQTLIHGVTSYLYKDMKEIWPPPLL